MYLVTEPMPEVIEYNADSTVARLPHMALDFSGEIYARQEQGGLILLGTYEQANRVPWSASDHAVELRDAAPRATISTASHPNSSVAFQHYPAARHAPASRSVDQRSVHVQRPTATRSSVRCKGLRNILESHVP